MRARHPAGDVAPRGGPAGRAAAHALLALCLVSGCGYRPVGLQLPGGRKVSLVHLRPVDPSGTDELELAPCLSLELGRELGRRGLRLAARHRSDAELHARLARLRRGPVVLRDRQVAAAGLSLALEVRLTAPDGQTLWRSGLVEVDAPWVVSGETLAAEQSRSLTLRTLCRRAAAEVVERLEGAL
ncbi:MAG: hypothetical protein IT371_06560 [Deltaproteobacteria bacterium]|nr:hypothetical protein [Deltaproteobacteria bacterium]